MRATLAKQKLPAVISGCVAALLLATPALAQEREAPEIGVDGGLPHAEPSLFDQLTEAAGQPTPTATLAPAPSPTARAFQSLNPDISVLLDFTGGFAERAPLRLAGDDPDLGGSATSRAAGFTLQEAEFGFQATVDPYLRAEAFLTIPNLSGLEVEEAFVTTTALPGDVQLKAGVFRSSFGRQNGQHLHVQDFTRRPWINASYLGTDGLRAPGAQVSWLVPAPFFLQVNLEGFSVAPPDEAARFFTFGGGARTDLTWAGELKTFASLSESLSVAAGVSAATGLSPGMETRPDLQGMRSFLSGADLYMKYKPPNQAQHYFSVAWTTEYFARKTGAVVDGGLYSQLVFQVARRWFVGLREDVLGLPASTVQPLQTRSAASLTFSTTEFARLRCSLEREFANAPDVQDRWGAYLQLEISMGAHGAHAF